MMKYAIFRRAFAVAGARICRYDEIRLRLRLRRYDIMKISGGQLIWPVRGYEDMKYHDFMIG